MDTSLIFTNNADWKVKKYKIMLKCYACEKRLQANRFPKKIVFNRNHNNICSSCLAMGISEPEPVGEIIYRECLRCDRDFRAEGKFNRICNKCKEHEEFTDAYWINSTPY